MTGISVAISRISRNNFKHQYLKKLKTFSGSFILFLECASNSGHFEKKDAHPSLIFTEIIDSERVGYLNV